MSKKIFILIIALLVIILAVVLVLIFGSKNDLIHTNFQNIVCTQEAKVCPDGSTVNRIGPNCEFADCSIVIDKTYNWRIYKNNEYGFEIKYPDGWRYSEERYSVDMDDYIFSVGFIPDGQDMGYEGSSGMYPIMVYVNKSPGSSEGEKISVDGVNAFKGATAYDFFINTTDPSSNGYYYSLIERQGGILFEINNEEVPIESYRPDNGQPSEIFNQMLSTFKFINN